MKRNSVRDEWALGFALGLSAMAPAVLAHEALVDFPAGPADTVPERTDTAGASADPVSAGGVLPGASLFAPTVPEPIMLEAVILEAVMLDVATAEATVAPAQELLSAGPLAAGAQERVLNAAGAAEQIVAAAPRNAIRGVVAAVVGNATVVRIALREALAVAPAAFLTHQPARLAIDLPALTNELGKAVIELPEGDVRSVQIANASGRTRLVLKLRRPGRYALSLEGETLVVTIQGGADSGGLTQVKATQRGATAGSGSNDTAVQAIRTVAESGATAWRFAAPDGGEHTLREIDFRRGAGGEARVLVDLSDPGAGVDIRQQGPNLVVDFLKTALPEALRRKFDVADFGTAVRSVRATQQGEDARLVIEPQNANGPAWETHAYQSDRQFVLELKPAQEDSKRLPGRGAEGYRGERLSLNFQNIDVRALLQVIADFTNLNIVTSDSVQGTLTLRLKDVPWDQALEIVLQSRGLDMRRNGNVLMIAPREEIALREKLELESRAQVGDIEPLRSETFQLNWQKAEALGRLLSDERQRVLSRRGSVLVDSRTNKLFVQDVSTRLEEVRRLIAQVDIAMRQVLIEARIVEADDRFSRNLGAKLGYRDRTNTVYNTVTVPDGAGGTTTINVPAFNTAARGTDGLRGTLSGNISGATDLSGQNGTDLTGVSDYRLGRATADVNTQFVNLPASAIAGVNPATFAFSLFGSGMTRFLNLELSALEADQRGKVVSSPRVMTADQGKAVIEQGTELPFQSATSSGATAVSFRKASLRLEVTPHITPDGSVILDVAVNRDAVGQLTPAGFAIDTRAVRTQVLVENGGTVVIGGIYEQFERNRTSKVPLLGDIPVLGNLFRNVQRTNDKTELLVFLTPRVITDLVAGGR